VEVSELAWHGRIHIMHRGSVKRCLGCNGKRWSGQRVLVIGLGNSGGEIAIDLSEQGAHAAICVRSPVNVVPRDFLSKQVA
jgi:alkyl hydroperoxide reductase subunit AhpF